MTDLIIAGGYTPNGIVGAKQIRCSKCGVIQWISPASQKLIASRTESTAVQCHECVKKTILNDLLKNEAKP